MIKGKAPVIILGGSVHSGKSSLLAELVTILRQEKVKVSGIIAEGLWEGNKRSGFNLIDLTDGSITPLSRRVSQGKVKNGIPFVFLEAGLAAGKQALSPERCTDTDVVIVDEVGILESRGCGWAECLDPLLQLRGLTHLWVVRNSCLEAIRDRWGLIDAEVIMVGTPDALQRMVRACRGGRQRAQGKRLRSEE